LIGPDEESSEASAHSRRLHEPLWDFPADHRSNHSLDAAQGALAAALMSTAHRVVGGVEDRLNVAGTLL